MAIISKLVKILREAVTWAFAGALFGGFFAGLLAFFMVKGTGDWLAFVHATTIAGTVIAAFFGSMLVALGGTLAGILIAISYQILFSSHGQPLILLGAALILGFLAGTFFTKREIANSQPLAQAASGLVAGLIAGPLVAIIVASSGIATGHWGVSAISVSFVGLIYVFASRHVPKVFRGELALELGGPLVSGVIAMSVAFSFWVIGSTYMTMPGMDQASPFQAIVENTPMGLLGGLLGGAFGGAMLEILGFEIEEHIH